MRMNELIYAGCLQLCSPHGKHDTYYYYVHHHHEHVYINMAIQKHPGIVSEY